MLHQDRVKGAFLKLTRAQALRLDGANAPWCSRNARKWNFYLNDDWGCGSLLARKVWNAHKDIKLNTIGLLKGVHRVNGGLLLNKIERKFWLKVSSVHHFFTYSFIHMYDRWTRSSSAQCHSRQIYKCRWQIAVMGISPLLFWIYAPILRERFNHYCLQCSHTREW